MHACTAMYTTLTLPLSDCDDLPSTTPPIVGLGPGNEANEEVTDSETTSAVLPKNESKYY